jgi:hypothetical protein
MKLFGTWSIDLVQGLGFAKNLIELLTLLVRTILIVCQHSAAAADYLLAIVGLCSEHKCASPGYEVLLQWQGAWAYSRDEGCFISYHTLHGNLTTRAFWLLSQVSRFDSTYKLGVRTS